MCLFLQHNNKWRHVSYHFSGHRLHRGEMSCLKMLFSRKFAKYLPYRNFRTRGIWALVIQRVPKEVKPF